MWIHARYSMDLVCKSHKGLYFLVCTFSFFEYFCSGTWYLILQWPERRCFLCLHNRNSFLGSALQCRRRDNNKTTRRHRSVFTGYQRSPDISAFVISSLWPHRSYFCSFRCLKAASASWLTKPQVFKKGSLELKSETFGLLGSSALLQHSDTRGELFIDFLHGNAE